MLYHTILAGRRAECALITFVDSDLATLTTERNGTQRVESRARCRASRADKVFPNSVPAGLLALHHGDSLWPMEPRCTGAMPERRLPTSSTVLVIVKNRGASRQEAAERP